MRIAVGLVAACVCASPVLAQKPIKQAITVDGRERTYQVFTPAPSGSELAPLLVLLHGSGRDSSSILDPWQSFARKEHMVLVAPASLDRMGWNLATDGPDFIKRIIDAVIAQGGIDVRRMYLFGHSAGGHHALDLALLESEYFAAAAVHAGVLTQPDLTIRQAERKIPLGLWNGTDDRLVPIAAARSTVQLLKSTGFPAVLNEMPRHTHDYYGSAGQVNAAVWQMLKSERLAADPKFKPYTFTKGFE